MNVLKRSAPWMIILFTFSATIARAEDNVEFCVTNNSSLPLQITSVSMSADAEPGASVENSCQQQTYTVSANTQQCLCSLNLQANTLGGAIAEGTLTFNYTYNNQSGNFGAAFMDPPVGKVQNLTNATPGYPFNSYCWDNSNYTITFSIPSNPTTTNAVRLAHEIGNVHFWPILNVKSLQSLHFRA